MRLIVSRKLIEARDDGDGCVPGAGTT